MSVFEHSIEPGVVYETPDGRERRVWTIRDGRVHYFERPSGGGAYWRPGHPPHDAPTVEVFAAEIRRLNGASGKSPLNRRKAPGASIKAP